MQELPGISCNLIAGQILKRFFVECLEGLILNSEKY